jgi:hypothetical protein
MHVSRMYLAPKIRTSLHTFEIHVSHDVSLMYPACILYVSHNTGSLTRTCQRVNARLTRGGGLAAAGRF